MLGGLGFSSSSCKHAAPAAGICVCSSTRGPLLKGRTLSKEAIAVMQRLQNVGRRRDADEISRVLISHVSRLLKDDMVKVFEMLHRKNECLMAFEVFKFMKMEAWYVPNAYRYRRMMEMFGKSSMILRAEEIFVEYQQAGLPLDANIYTELMGAYLRCKRPQDAINTFHEMKQLSFKPEEFTYKTMVKGLYKNGWREDAAAFRKEYHSVFPDNRKYDV